MSNAKACFKGGNMYYPTRLETNVKGFRSVELGPRTLIVGRCRTGKTAILNGIELALVGRAYDVGGHEHRAAQADLIQIGNGSGVWSTLRWSDGATSTFAAGTVPKAVQDVPGTRQGSLPWRDVDGALTASPERARRHLLSLAPVLAPEALSSDPVWLRAYEATSPTEAPVDRVIEALALVKKLAAQANAHAEKEREIIAELQIAQRPAGGSVENAEELAQQLANANVTIGQHRAFQQLAEKLAACKTRVEKLRAEVQAAKPTDTAANTALVGAVRAIVDRIEEKHLHKCPICDQGLPPTFAARIQKIRAITAQPASAPPSNKAAQLAHAEGELRQLQSAVEHAPTAEAYAQALKAVVALPTRVAAAQFAAAQAKNYALAQTKLASRQTALAEHEQHARETKALYTELTDRIRTLTDESLDHLIADVNTRLPAGWVFGVEVKEGKKGIRFGLMRKEGTKQALDFAISGAEWATLILAIAQIGVTEPGAVLIPEERSYDPETLVDVMQALATSTLPIVMTSTIAPARAPKGWVVVNL